ncbi:hypothetical protein ScPMuIL_010451 [Solemya velum]
MGCGRSKYNSQKNNPDENVEDENSGKKHKVSSKQEKNKQANKKENQPVIKIPKSPMSPKSPKNPKSPSKGPKKNTTGLMKKNSSSPAASKKNSPSTNGTSQKDYLTVNQGQSRLEVIGPKSAFKGKQLPVNGQEMKVTHSQVEFFKMLDERIEQGPPGLNSSQEELEHYRVHETLEELEIEDETCRD